MKILYVRGGGRKVFASKEGRHARKLGTFFEGTGGSPARQTGNGVGKVGGDKVRAFSKADVSSQRGVMKRTHEGRRLLVKEPLKQKENRLGLGNFSDPGVDLRRTYAEVVVVSSKEGPVKGITNKMKLLNRDVSKQFGKGLGSGPVPRLSEWRDGNPIIRFSKSDIRTGASFFSFSLVMKFTKGRPTAQHLQRMISSHWKPDGRFSFSEIWDSHHVIVNLGSKVDMNRALNCPIKRIGDCSFQLSQWNIGLDLKRKSNLCRAWIVLPDLPLFLYDKAFVKMIVSSFASVIKLDEASAGRRNLKQMRVSIETYKEVVIPDKVWIELSNNMGFWQVIQLDGSSCSRCRMVEHNSSNCPIQAVNSEGLQELKPLPVAVADQGEKEEFQSLGKTESAQHLGTGPHAGQPQPDINPCTLATCDSSVSFNTAAAVCQLNVAEKGHCTMPSGDSVLPLNAAASGHVNSGCSLAPITPSMAHSKVNGTNKKRDGATPKEPIIHSSELISSHGHVDDPIGNKSQSVDPSSTTHDNESVEAITHVIAMSTSNSTLNVASGVDYIKAASAMPPSDIRSDFPSPINQMSSGGNVNVAKGRSKSLAKVDKRKAVPSNGDHASLDVGQCARLKPTFTCEKQSHSQIMLAMTKDSIKNKNAPSCNKKSSGSLEALEGHGICDMQGSHVTSCLSPSMELIEASYEKENDGVEVSKAAPCDSIELLRKKMGKLTYEKEALEPNEGDDLAPKVAQKIAKYGSHIFYDHGVPINARDYYRGAKSRYGDKDANIFRVMDIICDAAMQDMKEGSSNTAEKDNPSEDSDGSIDLSRILKQPRRKSKGSGKKRDPM